MRNSNDPIENRTRGLPAGNAVPQPNALTACHNTSVQTSTLISFVRITRTTALLQACLNLKKALQSHESQTTARPYTERCRVQHQHVSSKKLTTSLLHQYTEQNIFTEAVKITII